MIYFNKQTTSLFFLLHSNHRKEGFILKVFILNRKINRWHPLKSDAFPLVMTNSIAYVTLSKLLFLFFKESLHTPKMATNI